MLKKLVGKIATKLTPYWCPYCPYRTGKEKSFEYHFLHCEARKRSVLAERKVLEAIAPVNRKQRRNMAKRSHLIKDWKKLNG